METQQHRLLSPQQAPDECYKWQMEVWYNARLGIPHQIFFDGVSDELIDDEG